MIVGLDLGTTNVKAVLVAPDGRVVARCGVPVALVHGEGGRVEQDAEAVFQAACEAIRGLAPTGRLGAVRALGISSQGGALQILDGADRPVGLAVSWLDGRARAHHARLSAEYGPERLAELTGHPRSTMALGQLLRLREQDPAMLDEPHRIAFLGDVVVGRLCGRRAHDATSLSCAVLYNPATDAAEASLLERLGLRADQLPPLLGPREPAGGLSDAAAEATGLPAGIPVSAAVHDQYAAALAVGAIADGDVMFGAGTAWVLLAVSADRPGPAGGVGFVCRHLAEGRWGQILSLVNGGSALDWAIRLTGLTDAGGERLDALLAEAGPGSGGLRCGPWLSEASPAHLPLGVAGRLTGVRLHHGPAQLLRAVVEGLTMELTRHLRLLERAGSRPRRLVMGGSAAASRVTPAIVADVTGLPVACGAESAASALGAAILARGLLEPETPLAELSARMASPARTVEPGPDRPTYAALFDEYLAALPTEAQP